MRYQVVPYRLRNLPRQKSTTPHTFIHASTQFSLLINSHAFIYHTELFSDMTTPRHSANYMHVLSQVTQLHRTGQETSPNISASNIYNPCSILHGTSIPYTISMTEKKRTPRASSRTHCIILHACPSIFLHLSRAGRSSARHDLSMLLYHYAAVILKARKKRTLSRHNIAKRTDA
jgi:hypothetical protein